MVIIINFILIKPFDLIFIAFQDIQQTGYKEKTSNFFFFNKQKQMQPHRQRLKQLYEQINPSKEQYIKLDKLREWFRLIFSDKSITEQMEFKILKKQFENSFDQWVQDYLRHVLNLEPENIKNPQFNQIQSMKFLEVLIQQLRNLQQQQQIQNQNNNNQVNDQKQQRQINNNSKMSHKSNRSPEAQKNEQQLQYQTPLNQLNKSIQNDKRNQNPTEFFDQNKKQPQRQQQYAIQQQVKKKINMKSTQKTNQFKINELQQKYKQYLQCIFQHYCKISYGTGQDVTFDSIQKKTSIMTLNKYMVFCKDFQLNVLLGASLISQNKQKASKNNVRNMLIDIFKKNSEFYKQMSFEQFQKSLQKIGEISFNKMKENQKQQQLLGLKSEKLSYQMIKVLKYLQISNPKQFKQKMNKLNINFALKVNKQLTQKKIPFNYKFKYQPGEQNNNNKFQQLKQRDNSMIANSIPNLNAKLPPKPNSNKVEQVYKQRQRNKIVFKSNRDSVNNGDLDGQNKTKYHLDIASINNRKQKDGNSQLSHANFKPIVSRTNQNKNLTHQIDRKVSSTKNLALQKRNNLGNHTPMQPLTKVPNKKQSLQKLPTTNNNVFASVEGYANIHLAKKGLLKQADIVSMNKNAPSLHLRNKKSQFQLNNIVQQARNIIHYDNDMRSGRAMSNISESKPRSFYSRQPISNQSNRKQRMGQALQINQMQNVLTRKNGVHHQSILQSRLKNSKLQAQNQLNGLLDLNDSDEDEFLEQHLKKQKQKNNQINVRIDKKIGLLNQRR